MSACEVLGGGILVGVAKMEGGVESGGCGDGYPGVLFWCIGTSFLRCVDLQCI